MAKEVFGYIIAGDERLPSVIIDEKGLSQISSDEELVALCQQVIVENPGKVNAYQGGKKGLVGFFMGQVMQLTKGQADPPKTKELMVQLLDAARPAV